MYVYNTSSYILNTTLGGYVSQRWRYFDVCVRQGVCECVCVPLVCPTCLGVCSRSVAVVVSCMAW